MKRGWSDPHLSLSGLLALLLLDQLRADALRRLPRLRGVLPSRLSCTLPARSRLLGACGVFELPQHLRHLMMAALVAELEGCDSTIHLSTDVHAHLRQRLHRLHVPLVCRLVERRRSISSLRVLVHAQLMAVCEALPVEEQAQYKALVTNPKMRWEVLKRLRESCAPPRMRRQLTQPL
jgi:hypothetical protein